jgi:hypothetical protein
MPGRTMILRPNRSRGTPFGLPGYAGHPDGEELQGCGCRYRPVPPTEPQRASPCGSQYADGLRRGRRESHSMLTPVGEPSQLSHGRPEL